MIHHISISANDPLHVAQVLAELWQGGVIPFPGHDGSYVALNYDSYGTMIEVLPKGIELVPGSDNEGAELVSGLSDQAGQFAHNPQASAHTATHAAISVPVSEAVIQEIAAREGWRAVRCDRKDFFSVIEFWVENQVLIELLPPSFASRYLTFMQPEALKQFAATSNPA